MTTRMIDEVLTNGTTEAVDMQDGSFDYSDPSHYCIHLTLSGNSIPATSLSRYLIIIIIIISSFIQVRTWGPSLHLTAELKRTS